jgi:hypothetical protein
MWNQVSHVIQRTIPIIQITVLVSILLNTNIADQKDTNMERNPYACVPPDSCTAVERMLLRWMAIVPDNKKLRFEI